MGFELEQEMNDHFAPFYPYVADEVLAEYGSASGRVLEVGPYGPGVSIALARKCPEMSFVCGDESGEALAYIRKCVRGEKLTRRVEILNIDKDSLLFDADTFDLVIFRGGLFFWEGQERILSEMNRVLKPGGTAEIIVDLVEGRPGTAGWSAALGLEMAVLSAESWGALFEGAGFDPVRTERVLDRRGAGVEADFKPSSCFPDWESYAAFQETGSLYLHAKKPD